MLAGVDLAGLNGHDLITLAPVIMKQVSHYQAMLIEATSQVAHCPAGDADSPPRRTDHTNQWAQVDLAAGLRCSARKAEHELRLAVQLDRLPMLRQALAGGELDLPRVRTIVAGLVFIDDEPARLLVDGLLRAGATSWTSRQISDRLRRAVLAFDPTATEQRRRHAESFRRMSRQAHVEGTVSICAENLPAERAAAMMERVDAIAHTARRQGDPRTLDQLRADVVCDLLAGTGVGATPAGPVTNPAESESPAEPENPAETAEPAVPLPGPRRGVVNVTAWLSTILGHTDTPGEIPGIGPVTAGTVRSIVAKYPDLKWRLSLFDDLSGCDGSCGCDGTCNSRTGELAWHGTLTGHGRAAPRTPRADTGTTEERDGFAAADVAFIRARDRTCRGPQACATPAESCDTDHTLAKVDGGGHDISNGGPFCRREHRYKHLSGARLTQPAPGRFVWTTQFGHSYTVRPETPDDRTGPPPRDPTTRLRRVLPY